jgi:hypothetical protein
MAYTLDQKETGLVADFALLEGADLFDCRVIAAGN